MALAYRRAARTDAAVLAELEVRALRHAGGPPLPGHDLAARAVELAAVLADPAADERWWIAERDTAVAGFAHTAPAGDGDADLGARAAELVALAVAPEHLGAGVGRRLLGHAVNDLLARGHGPVCVHVVAGDAHAIRFGAHHGFLPDGHRRTGARFGADVEEIRLVRRP